MKSVINQDEIHKLLLLLAEGLVYCEKYLGRSFLTDSIRAWYFKNAPEYFPSDPSSSSFGSN